MLNNTFTLIGTAISKYEKVENSKYEKWTLSVEVERKNKVKVDVYKVVVLNWNKTIDVKNDLVGEVVIVNGYLDTFNDNVSLIAQDIYIVGSDLNYKSKVENKIAPNEIDLEEEDEEDEIPDDELPF